MLPRAFSLTDRMIGAIDAGETDILFSGVDVGIPTRSQDLGNCWTYPSLNSIETSAIAKGLVSDPSQIEGNEWHLTLNNTGAYEKGLAINKTDADPSFTQFELGNFGGSYWFGTSYFASGKTGAYVVESPEQRDAVTETVDDAKAYYGKSSSEKLDRSQIANLYADPSEKRIFSYETGLTLQSTKKAQRHMKKSNTSAYVSFRYDGDQLDFFDYHHVNESDKDYSHWIDSSSLKFVDSDDQLVSIKAFFREALASGVITSAQRRDWIGQLKNRSTPGELRWIPGREPDGVRDGGHAVTAIGWNDDYIPPTVNYLNTFIDYLFPPDSHTIVQDQLETFKEWAESEGYAYTNAIQKSSGAWFIQNSWGDDKKTTEFQYLPYEMIDNNSAATFHELDGTGTLGDVDSSAVIPPLSAENQLKYFDAIGYNFDLRIGTPIAALGVMSLPLVEPSLVGGLIQGSIYRLDELQGDPIVSTSVSKQIHGYQTLRFDEPVVLDPATQYVAVVESADQGGNSVDSQFSAFKIKDPSLLRDISQSEFKPDQAEYYHQLPVTDLNLIKTSGDASSSQDPESIAENVYFAQKKNGKWFDLGARDSVFMLNVVYENQDNIVLDNFDVITGGFEVNKIFLNDSGNTVSAGAGDDIVHANASRNRVRLGSGNDVLIATEAKGRRLVVNGGTGEDTFVYSMGQGSHFKGKSTIRGFEAGDQILVHGFDDALLFEEESANKIVVSSDEFSLKIKGSDLTGMILVDGILSLADAEPMLA